VDFDDFFDDDKMAREAFGDDGSVDTLKERFGSRTPARIAAASFYWILALVIGIATLSSEAIAESVSMPLLLAALICWSVLLVSYTRKVGGIGRMLWLPFTLTGIHLMLWVFFGPPVGEGRGAWGAYWALVIGMGLPFVLAPLSGAAGGS
jgi:hypothetical protein